MAAWTSSSREYTAVGIVIRTGLSVCARPQVLLLAVANVFPALPPFVSAAPVKSLQLRPKLRSSGNRLSEASKCAEYESADPNVDVVAKLSEKLVLVVSVTPSDCDSSQKGTSSTTTGLSRTCFGRSS